MDGVMYVFNRDDICIGDKILNNLILRFIEWRYLGIRWVLVRKKLV